MSTKRSHRATSKEGESHIKPFRTTHKQRVKEALVRLKIGGTQEEISVVAGMRPDQVWKRMNDLVDDGDVFDTGITRKLKSGVNGIVWQLTGHKPVEVTDNPKTQEQQIASKILKQLGLLKQSSLF